MKLDVKLRDSQYLESIIHQLNFGKFNPPKEAISYSLEKSRKVSVKILMF